ERPAHERVVVLFQEVDCHVLWFDEQLANRLLRPGPQLSGRRQPALEHQISRTPARWQLVSERVESAFDQLLRAELSRQTGDFLKARVRVPADVAERDLEVK